MFKNKKKSTKSFPFDVSPQSYFLNYSPFLSIPASKSHISQYITFSSLFLFLLSLFHSILSSFIIFLIYYSHSKEPTFSFPPSSPLHIILIYIFSLFMFLSDISLPVFNNLLTIPHFLTIHYISTLSASLYFIFLLHSYFQHFLFHSFQLPPFSNLSYYFYVALFMISSYPILIPSLRKGSTKYLTQSHK